MFQNRIETNRYIIDKFIFTEQHLEVIKKYWHVKRFEKYGESLTIGKEYLMLYDKSQSKPMMTDNEFEMITNQKFIDNAKGDVIIFGLGIGLIVYPLLQDDNIKSITIVEVDKDLIDETFSILLKADTKSKLKVVNSDAFQYQDDKKYDTIYFDIWAIINEQSFHEMKVLSNKFSSNLNQDGWIDSWCSEEENY
jgi:spermidine synthase